MKDTIVYQNGQPVPVLPCLQRPDVLLRVRPGAVIVIDVKEESWLHRKYGLPLGSVNFVVLKVEEASVRLGKEFFVKTEEVDLRDGKAVKNKLSFLLSTLADYQAVIDQPEMLLECWDESPDVVAVKGKAVPLMVVPPEQEQEEKTEPPEQDPLQALKVGDWIARQDNTGTTLAVIREVWRASPNDLLCMSAEYLLISTGQQPGEVFSCSVESLKKIGWKILEGSTEISPPVREQITLNEPQEPDLWKQLDTEIAQHVEGGADGKVEEMTETDWALPIYGTEWKLDCTKKLKAGDVIRLEKILDSGKLYVKQRKVDRVSPDGVVLTRTLNANGEESLSVEHHSAQKLRDDGWEVLPTPETLESIQSFKDTIRMIETHADRELLRDMQNLLHDAWDGWGGDVGLTDREIIALVGLRVVGTLLRKNADYGCSVWKAPVLAPDVNPLKAMLCRTSDKVERIATLSAGAQPQVVGEGLKDSILDNAGYSILMLGYILKQEMAAGKLAGKGARHGEV